MICAVVQLSRPTPKDSGPLNMSCSTSAASGGFSLLEVLIALLILALGILGAASLQLSALRYHSGSLHATQASLLANDLLERLRANPEQLASYALTLDQACDESGAGQLAPVSESILQQDKIDFARAVACELPAGRARVAIRDGVATIILQWSEARQFVGAGDAQMQVSALIRGEL